MKKEQRRKGMRGICEPAGRCSPGRLKQRKKIKENTKTKDDKKATEEKQKVRVEREESKSWKQEGKKLRKKEIASGKKKEQDEYGSQETKEAK